MDVFTSQEFLARKRLRKRKHSGEVDHCHSFFMDSFDDRTHTYEYNYKDELEYMENICIEEPEIKPSSYSPLKSNISTKENRRHIPLDLFSRKRLRKRKDDGQVDHSHSFFLDDVNVGNQLQTLRFSLDEEVEYIKIMANDEYGDNTEPRDWLKCQESEIEDERQYQTVKTQTESADQEETSDEETESKNEEEEVEDHENNELVKFPVGSVVWGKFGKTHWWPAIVIHGKQAKQRTKPNYVWLYWLSDRKLSQVKSDNLAPFHKQLLRHLMKKPRRDAMEIGIERALWIFKERQQGIIKDSKTKEKQQSKEENRVKNEDSMVPETQQNLEIQTVYLEDKIRTEEQCNFEKIHRVNVKDPLSRESHTNDNRMVGNENIMSEETQQNNEETKANKEDMTSDPLKVVQQQNNEEVKIDKEDTTCLSIERLQNDQIKAEIEKMMSDPLTLLELIKNNSEILNPLNESTIPTFVIDDLKIYEGQETERSSQPCPMNFRSFNRHKNRSKCYGDFHSDEACLACLTTCPTTNRHPLFEGLLCERCKIAMKKHMFAIDTDGCSLVCAICADFGFLVVCGNKQCGKCYCIECINNFTSKAVSEKIEKEPDWICFLCKGYSEDTHGKIVPRENREEAVIQFYNDIIVCDDLNYLTCPEKRKIRILSLFDGIGTGKVVLDELGLDIDVYYYSEICQDALDVIRHNHKDTVKQLGDTWKLNRKQLVDLCPIDLVLAGPPCNDLSIVNPRRKGFEGSGILILKFQMLLREIETLCKGSTHVFWMMENTGSMLTQYKQDIADSFGMEPAVWDAKYFSGQRRSRNFWGNIPGLYSTPDVLCQLKKEKTTLDDVLTPGHNRKAVVPHTRTITSQPNSLTITNGKNDKLVTMDGVEDGLWIEEIERLFGFPTGYTDTGSLSDTSRRRLLGKAWSVPVVKQILSPLKKYFKLRAVDT